MTDSNVKRKPGRPAKYNSPRAYIGSRKEQVDRFREAFPGDNDYDRVEKCLELKKEQSDE